MNYKAPKLFKPSAEEFKNAAKRLAKHMTKIIALSLQMVKRFEVIKKIKTVAIQLRKQNAIINAKTQKNEI